MKTSLASIGILAITALFPASVMAEAETETQSNALGSPNPQQILYVGNSYQYYNNSLHNYVKRMAEAAYPDTADQLKSKSVTISGAYLSQHEVKNYLFPGALGFPNPFDVVVLQGHSAAALSDEKQQEFRDAVLRHHNAIEATGAETVLYMTPAYSEDHDSYDAGMTDKIEELYTSVGNEIGAPVIPVGLAFQNAYEQRPELALHVDYDGSHPSPEGSYLAAATVFATLYDTSVVGNPYTYYGRIDEDTAAFLQQVAEDTVAEYNRR
ncbi:hypothetical protein EI168_07550 [Halomonas sp. FME1]|uniref:Lysophospholipase L1 n=1 Tax=Halomonas casei TaxID=2742613 RepID=A0ABR9F219_9GAMM|nr:MULTISPECIES: DUF4886 domain-containing protein [Halomonas]MBE0399966.1 hypothetical protein [Halomonas casei]PCC20697.1 hypothetical protein CIK78_00575 [Halomonas sp. JB37]